MSKRRHCTFLPHFPELGRAPGACYTCRTRRSSGPSLLVLVLVRLRSTFSRIFPGDDFRRFLHHSIYCRLQFWTSFLISFRFPVASRDCLRIPVSLRSLFHKTICGVFYPDCVGQGSASELTSLNNPRDLNGFGYFHARMGWTGFGLRANIVEKYVLFRAVLHVAVALE